MEGGKDSGKKHTDRQIKPRPVIIRVVPLSGQPGFQSVDILGEDIPTGRFSAGIHAQRACKAWSVRNGAKISGVRDGFLDRFNPVFDGGLRYVLLSAEGALDRSLGCSEAEP